MTTCFTVRRAFGFCQLSSGSKSTYCNDTKRYLRTAGTFVPLSDGWKNRRANYVKATTP